MHERRRGRRGPIIWIALLFLAVFDLACGTHDDEAGGRRRRASIPDLPGIQGVLTIGNHATSSDGGMVGNPLIQRSVWVPDETGEIEDVDLRGYLDGTFKWGWNQPGQSHVRIGRRGNGARYGEYELFRVAIRWGGLGLPEGTVVTEAALTYHVEEPVDEPRRLELYAIVRDWNPGAGGEDGDNISPPRRGEVWWRDARFEEEAWGLPGLGFASDVDPEADTREMPLATALCRPGDEAIVFRSDRLADWLTKEIAQDRTPSFLVKLSDVQEDTPGSLMKVFSTNHGDSANPIRRPRLELVWHANGASPALRKFVRLEHGRRMELARRPMTPGWISVSFSSEPGFEEPYLEIRGGRGAGEGVSEWQRIDTPIEVDWTWYELRILAVSQPVAIGAPFSARVRDTWIRTRAPEEQIVPWHFVSPSGREVDVNARFVGDFTWVIDFIPDEIGRWRYRWTHDFVADREFRSAPGRFDVIAPDRGALLRHLNRVIARVGSRPSDDPEATERARRSLMRIERAALQLETPASFRSPEGRALRRALNELRGAIDEPAPDPLPLERAGPPRWARESANERP